MRKMPGQPDSAPSSCLSQSSVLEKRLFTTRTTQTPPARASTLNSVAIGGEPGAQPAASLAIIRGGSQAVTTECDSMPGPKFNFAATGFPSRSSNSAGQNQAEIPGPVAMACQTSSGVPGTSTSTWIEERREASFFPLMMAPWDWISAAEGAPAGKRNLFLLVGRSGGFFRWWTDEDGYIAIGHPLLRLGFWDYRNLAATRFIF